MRVVVALAATLMMAGPVAAIEGCEPEPITAFTPTGIAGCIRSGEGIASRYGPGTGVAMNFCTWELRHSAGCGWVTITSLETGITVTVQVIDFGDLYTGTPDERIVDMQFGVVSALGLDFEQGLWRVSVCPALNNPAPIPPCQSQPVREGASSSTSPAPTPAPPAPPTATPSVTLPNTAMEVSP